MLKYKMKKINLIRLEKCTLGFGRLHGRERVIASSLWSLNGTPNSIWYGWDFWNAQAQNLSKLPKFVLFNFQRFHYKVQLFQRLNATCTCIPANLCYWVYCSSHPLPFFLFPTISQKKYWNYLLEGENNNYMIFCINWNENVLRRSSFLFTLSKSNNIPSIIDFGTFKIHAISL